MRKQFHSGISMYVFMYVYITLMVQHCFWPSLNLTLYIHCVCVSSCLVCKGKQTKWLLLSVTFSPENQLLKQILAPARFEIYNPIGIQTAHNIDPKILCCDKFCICFQIARYLCRRPLLYLLLEPALACGYLSLGSGQKEAILAKWKCIIRRKEKATSWEIPEEPKKMCVSWTRQCL